MRTFIVAASPLVRAGLENILAAQRVEVVGAVSSVELLADRLVEGEADVVEKSPDLTVEAADRFQLR